MWNRTSIINIHHLLEYAHEFINLLNLYFLILPNFSITPGAAHVSIPKWAQPSTYHTKYAKIRLIHFIFHISTAYYNMLHHCEWYLIVFRNITLWNESFCDESLCVHYIICVDSYFYVYGDIGLGKIWLRCEWIR